MERIFIRHASAVFIILKYFERDHLPINPVLLKLQQEKDNTKEKALPTPPTPEEKEPTSKEETEPQAKDFKFVRVDFSPDDTNQIQDLPEKDAQDKREEQEPILQETPNNNTGSSSPQIKEKNPPGPNLQDKEQENQKTTWSGRKGSKHKRFMEEETARK